ncbi:MAG: hypothetical protein IMZ61_05160 [Planctomycetes bacterium]|nr:hypothetical protein [Planctomycetota bacterium]
MTTTDIEEGQFIDGFICYGTRTSSGRDVYEGEFAKNVYNGKGKITFANGVIPIGTHKSRICESIIPK